LLELANPADAKFKSCAYEPLKRMGDVVRNWTLHLANESKRQVQLFVADPAQCGAVIHGVDQEIANVLGRTDSDEQSMHRFLNVRSDKAFPVRFRLNCCLASTIFRR
jgi:hypothetical protein